MPTMREVDKIPTVSERPKEMKVLCLGLSRTGTNSLYIALQQLGYNPYHGNQLFSNDRHNKCWEEGLKSKFYDNKSYGLDEFDKLLANYDAVTDCPCANFAEELIAAYPNAKVILTTREPDSWVRSMESCYYQILDILSWNPIVYLEPNEWGAFRNLLYMILTHITQGDWKNRTALRQGFLEHNDLVRSLVPKEKLLEFQAGQGWVPLCQFLNKPKPSSPYPKTNEGNTTANLLRMYYRMVLLQKATKVLPIILAVSMVIMSWIAWKMYFQGHVDSTLAN
ncbi:hypothetical protein OCU04_009644 [Sclerotinia nivalis]|uniref:NAD dependent epimerase/dehydratase n=1 Tax=Sclerotinia nivalis TaxID=352851 RepID=A0A9X0AFI8_9HELO|nr:hypothetical protein OCU04_009644 [Sclerotinia nivalis]